MWAHVIIFYFSTYKTPPHILNHPVLDLKGILPPSNNA